MLQKEIQMKSLIFIVFLTGCTSINVTTGPSTGTGLDTETKTQNVTGTKSDTYSQTVSNTVTQVATNTQTSTETKTQSVIDTASNTNTQTNTNTQSDTSSTTNTQTSTATQTNTATAPTPINLCLRPDLLTPGSPVSSDELMAGLASGFYYYADVAPGVCGDAIPIALCPNPIPGGPSVICPNMDTNFFFQCPSVTSNGTQNCQSQQNVRCGFCKKICNRC
jgi:hypothetical protein